MDGEGTGEGFNRGKQSLLQACDQEPGCGLLAFVLALHPRFTEIAILVEQCHQG